MQSNNLSFTHSNNTKILSSNSLGLAESKILQFETLLAKCLYYNGLIIESTPSTTISLKRTPRIGLGRSTVLFFFTLQSGNLPCEQRFFSGIDLSIYKET